MKELVINYKGQPWTTSRLVAGKFGKEHKNVLQAIENLDCSEEFSRLNFQPTSYVDSFNRQQREQLITRDGFSFLVMGFTGRESAKFKEEFIKAFNAMEETLRRMNACELSRMDILRLALQSEEERLRLQKDNERLIPKAAYYDKVLESASTYTTQQIAKEMGMSAVSLNRLLYESRVLYRQGEVWMLYHPYQGKGYTKTRTHVYVDGQGCAQSRMYLVWTERGRRFIHEKLGQREQAEQM